jgi:electron transfer flavoprotein alpha subunit
MSNVFILVDLQGDAVSKTTAELATAGARMGDVTAIVVAAPGKSGAIVSALIGPISSAICIESEDLATYGVPAYADLISQIVIEKKPTALLIASHAFGKEIAARVAIATDSGIITMYRLRTYVYFELPFHTD